MPTVYIAEDWNSLSTGPNNNPDGWDLQFGSGVVYNYFQNGGGQYPTDNWYQFQGGNLYTPNILSTPYEASIFWGFQVNEGALSIGGLTLLGLNAAATGTLALLIVRSEVNNSVSLYGFGDQLLYNTSNPPIPTDINPGFVYQQGIWYYAQLNVTLETDPGGSGYLQIIFELAINGISVASGSKLTNLYVPDLFSLGIWQLLFPSAATGFTGLSRIVMESPVPIDTYPNPTSPLPETITQMVMEYAQNPDDSSVEISQTAIEYASFPKIGSSVDISQMLIEVAFLPGAAGGWIVQEA